MAVNIGSTMRLNKKIRQSNKRPINKPDAMTDFVISLVGV
jgi:hypothetical protein